MDIPEWPFWPVIQLVLLYRRVRYGYPFRRIPLTQGKFAIVDQDDYERLSCYNWCAAKSGQAWYAIGSERINGKRRCVKMHRKIIEVGPSLCVDHINHNGLDNRKANLRSATSEQNMWNRRVNLHSSRFRGVTWRKVEKKWQAAIGNGRKRIYLGCFDDEVEAARAYDEAAKKLRGAFAVLNFNENENRQQCEKRKTPCGAGAKSPGR